MATLNVGRHAPAVIALLGLLACDRPRESASNANRRGSPEMQGTQTDSRAVPRGRAAVEDTVIRIPADPAYDVATLDDAQLAAVLQSLHQRLERGSEVAERSSQTKALKDAVLDSDVLQTYLMSRDEDLFGQLSLTPRVTRTSQHIDAETDGAMQTLATATPAAFDHDYVAWNLQTLRDTLQELDAMRVVATQPDLRAEIDRNRSELAPRLRVYANMQQAVNDAVGRQDGGGGGGGAE